MGARHSIDKRPICTNLLCTLEIWCAIQYTVYVIIFKCLWHRYPNQPSHQHSLHCCSPWLVCVHCITTASYVFQTFACYIPGARFKKTVVSLLLVNSKACMFTSNLPMRLSHGEIMLQIIRICTHYEHISAHNLYLHKALLHILQRPKHLQLPPLPHISTVEWFDMRWLQLV